MRSDGIRSTQSPNLPKVGKVETAPPVHSVTFTVTGIPVPWARSRHNGKQHYNDPKYAAWKEAVAWHAKAAMGRHKPMEGPVAVIMTFHMPMPISWSQRKRHQALEGIVRPDTKPDGDNMQKAIQDACNGVMYRDDAQIVHWVGSKVYSLHPCVSVTISRATAAEMPARFAEVA